MEARARSSEMRALRLQRERNVDSRLVILEAEHRADQQENARKMFLAESKQQRHRSHN